MVLKIKAWHLCAGIVLLVCVIGAFALTNNDADYVDTQVMHGIEQTKQIEADKTAEELALEQTTEGLADLLTVGVVITMLILLLGIIVSIMTRVTNRRENSDVEYFNDNGQYW